MAKKKYPFKVTYWDNDKDISVERGVETYDSALILQSKLRKRGHSNIQIKIK